MVELFARILRKRITETSFAGADLNSTLQHLHTTVSRELAIEQDRYYAEIYADPSKQPFWSDATRSRFAELDMYGPHSIVISTK